MRPLLTRPHSREQQPVWSPDGRSLAFISVQAGQSRLYRVAADGSELRALSPPELTALSPLWHTQHEILFSARTTDTFAIYRLAGQGLRRWLSGPSDLMVGSQP